jgi:hypothetical protein
MQRESAAWQIRDRFKLAPVGGPVLQPIAIVLRCARDMANMVCAHFDRTLDWTIS